MPNYEGSPNNLLKEPPKWKHLPSKAIRIPEVYADKVLNFARKLDNSEGTECTPDQSDSLYVRELPRTECTPGLGIKAVKQAKVLLTKALKLRANSGGAIKDEIRKALKLLDRA